MFGGFNARIKETQELWKNVEKDTENLKKAVNDVPGYFVSNETAKVVIGLVEYLKAINPTSEAIDDLMEDTTKELASMLNGLKGEK